MPAWQKLRGTIESLFNLGGPTGPLLKNLSGAIHARNAADAAFAQVHGDFYQNGNAPVALQAIITASPAADQNDYSPSGWVVASPDRILRLTPTTSMVLSGLADGSDGDRVTIFNASSDFLVILEDENTSSAAANRFALRNPVFLTPGATIQLVYDGGTSRWRVAGSSGGVGFGAFFDVFEDFGGTTGAFGNAVNGTGASVQAGTYLQNQTERPIGVWQADTGTTATGRAHIGFVNQAALGAAQGPAMYLNRVAVEALSNATDRYQIFAGFHDAVGATNVTDGIYWVYRDDVSAAWQSAVAAGGTRVENFAAGPTVDTNYIWLGIAVNAAWTVATFFYSTDSVNWIVAGTRNTGLPSGTQFFGLGATINKTVGLTQRNLSVDLMAYRYDSTRG